MEEDIITNGKTLISLRMPTELLTRLDEEANQNRRSRAFVIIDILEAKYKKDDSAKARAKAAKKAGKQ